MLPVVVVHHGAPDWCRSTIDAVLASEGIDVRLHVVDNSGDLEPASLPASATVLRPGANLGYAGGANHGLRRALLDQPDARVVAICSHDVLPHPTALRALADAVLDRPDVGIAGPVLSGATEEAGGTWRLGVARRPPPRSAGGVVDVAWVSGSLLVVRVEVLAALGGFDDRFGSYVEDVDLCLRAGDRGWRVVCVSAASARTRGSVADDRTARAAANAVLLVAKRHGRALGWLALLRCVARAGRGLATGTLALHRPPARRRASRRWAAAQFAAVRRAAPRIGAFAQGGQRGSAPASE